MLYLYCTLQDVENGDAPKANSGYQDKVTVNVHATITETENNSDLRNGEGVKSHDIELGTILENES